MEENKTPRRRSGDARSSCKKGGRVLRWTALIILVIFLLAISAFGVYAYQYNTIFPNIYVGDLALGGMTREDALELLNEKYYQDGLEEMTLSLALKDDKKELLVNDLNVVFENGKTVDQAIEQSSYGDIFSKSVALFMHHIRRTDIEPQISYEKELLDSTIDELATPYEVEPVNYTFEVEDNKVTIFGKVNGLKVDRDGLLKEIKYQLYTKKPSEIKVEPVAIKPEPLDFDEFYKYLTSKPQEARYEKGADGKIVVVPGKYQCTVDAQVVKDALAAVDNAPDKTYSFTVKTKAPENTTKGLEEKLYKDKLGSYQTWYSGTAARNNNVRLATSRVDGIEMMPNDEFSYDKTILKRTSANGYQAAPVYIGNKVESGMGGGICQPSSTLYAAALYANLEILERHNHSMLVGYMPAGLDATIAEGYLDLRLKNNTGYPIKIVASAEGGICSFEIWGYNPDGHTVEILRYGGGYNFGATRVVKVDGKEVSRETLTASRYQPKATEEPEETQDPEATDAPEGTDNPEATDEPKETDTPVPTATPTDEPPVYWPPASERPEKTPAPTEEPDMTDSPLSE